MWREIKALSSYFWRDLSFKRSIALGCWAWTATLVIAYEAALIIHEWLTR